MARYTEAKCRLCRREGVKLFLKSGRCLSPKCPVEKKGAVAPGMGSKRRRRALSEYGVQFREKQKVKRLYGVLERQFKRYFDEASKVKEATGDALLKILESRLDNVVYRLHLAPARVIARQLVTHRHIMVNGRIVNVPSFGVKPGDVIIVSPRGMEIPYVRETIAEKNVIIPNWLNRKAAGGKVERLPQRDEIEGEISEQLIVEHYSR